MNMGSLAIRGEIKLRTVRFFVVTVIRFCCFGLSQTVWHQSDLRCRFYQSQKAESPSSPGLSDVAVQRLTFEPAPNRLVSVRLAA